MYRYLSVPVRYVCTHIDVHAAGNIDIHKLQLACCLSLFLIRIKLLICGKKKNWKPPSEMSKKEKKSHRPEPEERVGRPHHLHCPPSKHRKDTSPK
jgi:hypothetical protein